jgi:hypothetical protein
MNARLFPALLLLGVARLLAQAPAAASPAPATQTHSNNVGFSYTFPADWEVVDMSSTLPDAQKQAQQNAATDQEKRGAACTQIALSARHGTPASTVVAVVLPFACLGAELTESDLAGVGIGATVGIQQNFDISGTDTGAYSLGSHSVWIQRSVGTLKSHSDLHYTVETVCTILKKGAVCWMTIAADETALKSFELGLVTLDSEAPAPLVPANAFAKKPS